MARIKWDKEILKEELIKICYMEKEGFPIKLYKDFPKVYYACYRIHGSIEDALYYANISLEDISFYKNNKWNYDEIKRGLLELLGKEMRGEKFNFSKDYPKLKAACRRNFKTVENAAKFFNLDKKLKFIRGENKWAKNPNKILKELKALYNANPEGCTNFHSKHKALCRACENHFESLRNALDLAGIPQNWIKKRSSERELSKEEIIIELQNLFIIAKLTLNEARKKDPYIFRSLRTYFVNIKDALKAAGINYEDVLVKNERNAGRLAEEKIVNSIFNELGISFKKGYTNKIRPDFVFKNYWVDAKLNYSDKNGWKQSIKKYKKHTKQLIIVYIFGPDFGLHRIESKILATHINYYIKQLPNHRQIYYRELIEEIRQFYLQTEEDFEMLLLTQPDIEVDKKLGKVTARRGNIYHTIRTETWQQSLEELLQLQQIDPY